MEGSEVKIEEVETEWTLLKKEVHNRLDSSAAHCSNIIIIQIYFFIWLTGTL